MEHPLFIRPEPTPEQGALVLAKLVALGGRPFLAMWIREGVDAQAMKDKIIDQLEKRVRDSDGDLYQWNEDTNLGNNLVAAAEEVEPEYFKCIDWLITQFAGQNGSVRDLYDAANFINRELGPVLLALRSKNKPWPQLRDKKFTPDLASEFVEQNMGFVPSGDVVGPYDEWDDTVFKLPGGWRIALLDPENIEREGEEMNNCLKDNDSYHWTDKAEQKYIVVLSLRDPLNRPHVSAACRYDDFQAGSLVYTEGPLLKNNRSLNEDADYEGMWREFEEHIKAKGGMVTSGSDDWEEDQEEEEPEPYHDEDRDYEEYGENLEVDSLWELKNLWEECEAGCLDWGRDYDRSETQYDSDWEGNPYYYYETYGGRQVNSTDSGLEYAVEEWIEEARYWDGEPTTPLEMAPRDFVGAVVMWATVLQDSEGYDAHKLLQDSANLLNEKANEYDDPDTEEVGRQAMLWAARELVSERSFAATKSIHIPYAGEDQRRFDGASEFAPAGIFEPTLGAPIEGWGEANGQQPQPMQDAGTWTGPRAPQPQQQPQEISPNQPELPQTATMSPERRQRLVQQVRDAWRLSPTPAYLNALGQNLMINEGLRVEQAQEILQEVTGEQVGYREGKVAADEGWYEDWGGPAPEPSNYMYGDFGPAGEGARFGPGDYVKMMHGSQGGVIVGEPVHSFEGLAYYVDTYDQEGPRGIELWAESLLHRPDSYDKPGESTLEDWFGITPEGEDYYRTAKR